MVVLKELTAVSIVNYLYYTKQLIRYDVLSELRYSTCYLEEASWKLRGHRIGYSGVLISDLA